MASASPAITTCPAPLLLATHTSPAACSQARRDDVVISAQDGGHGARTAIGGRLHRRAALGDEAHAVIEASAAPTAVERAVLAEAVAGGDGAAHAERSQGIVHDEAEHVGGELRVLRASELVGVGVEQEVRRRRGHCPADAAATIDQDGWSTQGRPIPGCWDPWPGKVKASIAASDRSHRSRVSQSRQVPPG